MKKLAFIFGLLAVAATLTSCEDDKVIQEKDLPGNAKSFLQANFSNVGVTRVEKDRNSYDVYLENGFEIDFKKSGDWDEVKNYSLPVPSTVIALIPENVSGYVSENYPDQFITGINNEHFGYEIDLSNGVELIFSPDGTFQRIDHD